MIPVRNLYLMLSYAWDRLEEAEALSVGIDQRTELKDLLASVLLNGVRRCVKEGIDRGYVERQVELAGLRGKLALSDSIHTLSLLKGMTQCLVDEFTEDILANQLIKTTLWRLSRTEGIDPSLRRELNVAVKRMPAVTILNRISRSQFRALPIHGNNRLYRFLINVCEFIFDSALADRGGGSFVFKDFVQDDKKMRRLFQKFVENFLRRHQTEYQVSVDRFDWAIEGEVCSETSLLPKMETDITLRSKNQVIVIDTKFSKDVLQSRFDKKSLRSEHLYQIFSYLKNLESRGFPFSTAQGLLLYPTVHTSVDTSFKVQGHTISIRTIDLTLPTDQLKEELLRITVGRSTNGSSDVVNNARPDLSWFEHGEELYRHIRDHDRVVIDMSAVEQAIVSGGAGEAFYQLFETFRSEKVVDGKGLALLHRAIMGWTLSAGGAGRE